ncbi:hypothetical protein [Arthrobacter crystallopoietes]|uniref:hypothetical protein n=1 Tax=Crystallibacter crystallopoietes TaxID=37928 RepID=UPI001110FD63|nr:hypothetical protein [Arthrobacter crystallopoietes]QTG81544.1 hypothetical protein J5251_02730 [Arthrobacter crystallopoietes]
MEIPEDGGRLEDDPEFAAMLEEFGFFVAPEGYEDEDDEPNPLWVEHGVLPPDAREHLLSNEDGRVIIDYPPDDQTGLEILAPVFDVVRSVQTSLGVTDFSLLDQIPHLEGLSIQERIKTPPTRREWPELRGYDGPWQPEAAPFVAAPRLDSLRLWGATQEALDLIQGPLSALVLQRLKLSDGSPGWPHPAEFVGIDTTRRVDVSRIHQLASAEKIIFDGIGEVSGLDVVSTEHPLRELELSNVRSLGSTINPWLIQADKIYVIGRPNVMKWVNEALLHRPDGWDQRWVFDHGWVP